LIAISDTNNFDAAERVKNIFYVGVSCAVMIVGRIRGEIIRSVLCCIVYNCAQS